jgi:nitroimidazol reductase NimA-like FMN-containing flavoprotein (pyridoxamine 5'-phosphate oxidase superfamily)
MDAYTPTPRTQVKRLAKRAVYDKTQVHSILDEGYFCHLGFVVDGQPYVIPTGYARVGDRIYIHGSAASRMLRTVEAGVDICVTVTLVDGLVLARAAFHHSMNYRSVVVLGKARLVTDPDEKVEALRSFTNHVVPGRWDEARKPNPQELKSTTVLALPLEEVSAKVRTGTPIDDEEDYALPIWAGVVPIQTTLAEPVPDSRVLPGVPAFNRARFRSRSNRTS